MATTPNYGWVTPAPTDLVTDLPADFEVFADAVDADLAGLLGGTTGQVLKKNSGTDHDFAWAVDPTTDVVTTAGDLIYGTGADAVTRLGIGTAGQVLTVNSGATAPEWATPSSGGITVLASGSLSGSTVDITNIPTTYKHLQLIIRNYLPDTDQGRLGIRFNGDSNANRHSTAKELTSSDQVFSATFISTLSTDQDSGTSQSLIIMDFLDYANTSTWKMVYAQTITNDDVDATTFNSRNRWGYYNQTGAITSLTILQSIATNFTSGTYVLYGVQ